MKIFPFEMKIHCILRRSFLGNICVLIFTRRICGENCFKFHFYIFPLPYGFFSYFLYSFCFFFHGGNEIWWVKNTHTHVGTFKHQDLSVDWVAPFKRVSWTTSKWWNMIQFNTIKVANKRKKSFNSLIISIFNVDFYASACLVA